MSAELQARLLQPALSPEQQHRNFQDIHHSLLMHARQLREPNFQQFCAADLELLFNLYDQRVLQGACRRALQGRPLTFHLSRRMTRAGGKTTWKTIHDRRTGVVREEFAISVSAHLLFQTFRDEQRTVTVTGCLCHNRLQAMQRIVEHELLHLGERLVWQDSNCRAQRFQTMARRLFGHQAHTHDLVTTSEVARSQYGVRPGSHVQFEFEGRRYQGIVNRITTRATVLVADPAGEPYSDGKRYLKFYIPLSMLQNSRSG